MSRALLTWEALRPTNFWAMYRPGEQNQGAPPIFADLDNYSSGSSTGPQNFAGGPLMSSQDLVPTIAQTLLRDAMAPLRQEGPPIAARGWGSGITIPATFN